MNDESTAQPPESPQTGAGAAGEPVTPAPETEAETTAETVVQPPGAAGDTAVQPPAPEPPTQVLGADAAPTRIGPAPLSAIGTPPPARPTPTLVQSGGGGERRFWIWIVIAAVVLAAVIAIVYVVWWPSDSGEGSEFVGTWAPVDMSGGGLVISEDGGTFFVEIYDRQLTPVRTVEASLEQDKLVFTTSAAEVGVTGVTGTLDAEIAYVSDKDELAMTLTDAQGASVSIEYLRIDQLVAAPSATPVPSVTPTSSPSPSPSPSPSLSPSASPSATTPDQAVIAAIGRLQAGIIAWKNANGGLYPAPAEVSATGGVADYVDPWPLNPFTNAPMQQGGNAGDYVYEQLDGGQNYRLTGNLANGLTYTVP